jgi:hypothetical protein
MPDQQRGFSMPAVTVKNTVRHDGTPSTIKRLLGPRTFMSMTDWIGGATNPI